ncbi:hypothetical protein OPQ81_004647 [Rhizoctonia solani]|nr:hypothetical protein OPQ81_004647 [Rhizoctonia solani]
MFSHYRRNCVLKLSHIMVTIPRHRDRPNGTSNSLYYTIASMLAESPLGHSERYRERISTEPSIPQLLLLESPNSSLRSGGGLTPSYHMLGPNTLEASMYALVWDEYLGLRKGIRASRSESSGVVCVSSLLVMHVVTMYKSLRMIDRSTARSPTAGFQHVICKSPTIAGKPAPNGDASPKRSFHGRRALNVQAVPRLIADQLAGNSGSGHSTISIAVPNVYSVITY